MSADALGEPRARAARHRAGPGPARRKRSGTAGPGGGEPTAWRVTRLATAATLLAVAALVPSQDQRLRDVEAWIASHVIALLGVQTGYLGGSLAMAWFAKSPVLHIGLIVTPDCTIALLTIPFLVSTALLVWQRAPLRRSITGLAVALLLLEVLNQARLLTIAGTILVMGYPGGYYWGHTLVGSIIIVVGLAAAVAIFAMLTLGRTGSSPSR
jgi:exosortase/archaeosortase family protein